MEKYGIGATGGRILVVEDDPDARGLIAQCLMPEYSVVATATGEEAYDACRQVRFDLALVDVRLPDMTGMELVPRMQGIDRAMPVILMTAFPRSADAYWAGDTRGVVGYLEKPFSVHELKQRVEQALTAAEPERWLRLGELVIDCTACEVLRDGQRVSLTRQEVTILKAIVCAAQNGEVASYGQLITKMWGCESHPVDIRALRSAVSRLRDKLGDDAGAPRYIETVRGVGYRLAVSAGSKCAVDVPSKIKPDTILTDTPGQMSDIIGGKAAIHRA